MILRIPHKLTGLFTVIAGVVLLGVFAYLYSFLANYTTQRIRKHLRGETELARLYVEHAARPSGAPVAWDALAGRIGGALHLRVTIIAPDGTMIGDSHLSERQLAGVGNYADRPEVRMALARGFGSSRRFSRTIHTDLLYTAVPFDDGGHKGVIRLAMSLADIHVISDRLIWALLIAFFVAFGLSVVTGSLVSRILLKPVREMSRVAKRIADGDFSQKIYFAGNDALGDLAAAINFMSEQIRLRIDEVRQEKSRLEAVLWSMVEGVLVVNRQGEVLLMNQALKDFLHVEQDPIGKKTLEVIRNIHVQEIITATLSMQKGVYSSEVSMSYPEEIALLVHATSIIRGGSVEGVLLVFHNITELRQLERVRREFVANVSHELRTPVASIKGYAETLLDGALEDKANAEDFLKIICADADRLARLIEDILDLSRIESGTMAMDIKPCPVAPVVQLALSGLQPRISEKALTVDNRVMPDTPMAMADRDRLAQVMLNLADNAVKYTPPGGRIRIAAQTLPGFLKISVQDSGIGIPAEDIPRLFERFYRVDKARSRELGGTGLGLAIVKHIVQAHKGEVFVESKPGKGSVFGFTVPLASKS